MRRMIFAAVIGLASVGTAWANAPGGGGGPQRISQAQARGANSISSEQCLSLCRSSTRNQAQCPGNCEVGQCYLNPNSGNRYCVRAQ